MVTRTDPSASALACRFGAEMAALAGLAKINTYSSEAANTQIFLSICLIVILGLVAQPILVSGRSLRVYRHSGSGLLDKIAAI